MAVERRFVCYTEQVKCSPSVVSFILGEKDFEIKETSPARGEDQRGDEAKIEVRKVKRKKKSLKEDVNAENLGVCHTSFNAPLHIGSSSSAHTPAHPHDSLSAISEAKISSVEAVEDVDAAVEEMAGDNPPTEANPTDDSEVPVDIVPEDVLLQYFGSVDVAPVPSLPIDIHRERVDESLAKGIPTSKEEFHTLRASLFRLSKETKDSPVLVTAYNDMALALKNLFVLHKMTKDSHDEGVATLQHLGSLRQENKHIQTSFNEPLNRPLNPLANYEE
ncbi:hypothetical protein RND71_021845 [Anisodus tanguticus]|uniref:Uncharacterized protein n=1 Tax=Anisodus tanguticus TaxID=243964 RepID=A0AAE1RZ81_9SOLA|nr:hypothetical protein RND71_021845 [Anisodus tanguticus]